MTLRTRLLPGLLLPLLLLVAAAVAPTPAAAAPVPRGEALARALEARRLSKVSFEATPLPDVVRWLRLATGWNIVVKQGALAKAGIDPADVVTTLTLEDVSVAQVLSLVLEPHGLGVVVRDNVIFVTTRQDALGRPVTHLYAISHLTWTKIDFIAPDIDLRPSDFVPADDFEPERVDENDPLTSGDAVAELVRELVRPGDWDSEGWSIRATDRYLVVRAPRSVHAEILRALRMIESLK
jgi:hypothetical protein